MNLQQRWMQSVILQAWSDSEKQDAFQVLQKQWDSPSRHYHTWEHLWACLIQLERYASHAGQEFPNVEMALFFHDAIYDTRRSDNETKSAEFAKEILPQDADSNIQRLILATKHGTEADFEAPETQVILDVDLSILGQPAKIYDEYRRNIRREFSWVADAEFAAGRGKVIRQFLDAPSIYRTRFFRDELETNARQNLENEMRQLRS